MQITHKAFRQKPTLSETTAHSEISLGIRWRNRRRQVVDIRVDNSEGTMLMCTPSNGGCRCGKRYIR